MYRVYVYRTDEKGNRLNYCTSRNFESIELALHFSERENKKSNREAVIVKKVVDNIK